MCFPSCLGGGQLFIYLELSESSLATECSISLKNPILRMENKPKICQSDLPSLENLKRPVTVCSWLHNKNFSLF